MASTRVSDAASRHRPQAVADAGGGSNLRRRLREGWSSRAGLADQDNRTTVTGRGLPELAAQIGQFRHHGDEDGSGSPFLAGERRTPLGAASGLGGRHGHGRRRGCLPVECGVLGRHGGFQPPQLGPGLDTELAASTVRDRW